MESITVDDHELDEVSQICLQVLRDKGGETTTGELRKAADVSQNQQIIYRIENHLIPAGLVEGAGEREMPGAAANAKIWRITDWGRSVLDENIEDIEKATDAAHAIESLKRTRQTVDEMADRLDDIESDMERFREKEPNWSSRLSKYSERISNVREMAESAAQADFAEHNRERIEDTESRLRDHDDRLDSIEDELTELRADVDGCRTSIEANESRIDRLKTDLSDVQQTAEKARKLANMAGQRAKSASERGLLDVILGRSGDS